MIPQQLMPPDTTLKISSAGDGALKEVRIWCLEAEARPFQVVEVKHVTGEACPHSATRRCGAWSLALHDPRPGVTLTVALRTEEPEPFMVGVALEYST